MDLKPNTKILVSDINYKTIEVNEIVNFLSFLGSSRFFSFEFSLYKNNNLLIRNSFHSNNDGDNIYLEQDILFLKLAKLGLLDIELFDIHMNLDTKEGEKAYKFIEKYQLKGGDYTNSETGKTKYDIKEILKDEKAYNNFIKHIFSNILKNDEVDEYFDSMLDLENLITMEVKLNNTNNFFEGISKIFLNKSKEVKEYLKEKLIKEYKSENNYIEFKISEYFKSYTYIYFLLKELEKSGKLKIEDIIIYMKMNGKIGTRYIKFKLEKSVNKLLPLFLENINLEKNERIKYKENSKYLILSKLDNEKKIKINSKPYYILKKSLELKQGEHIDFYDIIELIDGENSKITNKDIDNSVRFLNNDIEEKLKIKDFFTIGQMGFKRQYEVISN